MHQPAAPVLQAAIEPAVWFILFVILVNLLSPLLRRRRQTAAPQSQSQSSPVSTSSDAQATVAAERERIRQALAAALQQRRTQGAPLPTAQGIPAPITPVVMPAPVSVSAARTSVASAAVMSELPPLLPADGMQLMTLESSMQVPGARPPARAQGAMVPQLALLRGPRGIADAFVAAAIVGPCAAFRPLGHTPAGW